MAGHGGIDHGSDHRSIERASAGCNPEPIQVDGSGMESPSRRRAMDKKVHLVVPGGAH